MPSRLITTALPIRTVTRNAAIVATSCPKPPRVKRVNHDTAKFTTLGNSSIKWPANNLSSPTKRIAKSRNHSNATPKQPSSSSPWLGDAHGKAYEEDGRLDELCSTLVKGGQHGNSVLTQGPVGEELWLERFGGPGKRMEEVAGKEAVTMRDLGPDGMGYLRILI